MGGNKGTVSPSSYRRLARGRGEIITDSTLKVVFLTSYKPPKRSHEKTGGDFKQFDFRICSAASEAIIPGIVIRLAGEDL